MKDFIGLILLAAALKYLGFHNPFIPIAVGGFACLAWMFLIEGPRQTRAERKRESVQ